MLSSVMHKIQSIFHPQDLVQNLGWMDTLAEMGEFDALIETKFQLAKIDFSDVKNFKNKVDLVLEIDAKTYQNVKKVTHKLLTSMKINRDLESEIQNTVHLYQRQLYMSYMQFFDAYQKQNKIILSDEKMNLVLARFLNATFIMAKWRYFDDQPAPVGTWENVHKVIKAAENLSILNKNIFLYNFQIKETSIATLLKRGFMMDTLQKGNFTRLQVQLTEQVLKIWATNPLIVNKYKQGRYQFFIALENDRGPERVRAIEKFAEYRFWKTTRLADLIEAYLCAADTGKSLAAFGLDKVAPPSVMVKLFKKLRAEWCVEGYARQRRKEVRNKNSKLLNVSHGLHEIFQRLNALQITQAPKPAESGDFTFELKVAMHRNNKLPNYKSPKMGTENWWLVDESSGGLAVDLGKDVNNWIEAGKLVGYTSPEDKESFFIAEIKSLRKQTNGTYRAGLALMADNAVAMPISRVDSEASIEAKSSFFVDEYEGNSGRYNTFDALFIKNNAEDAASKMTLVMPRSEYKRGSQYRVSIEGEDRVVQAVRVQSKQRDWVHVEVLL